MQLGFALGRSRLGAATRGCQKLSSFEAYSSLDPGSIPFITTPEHSQIPYLPAMVLVGVLPH